MLPRQAYFIWKDIFKWVSQKQSDLSLKRQQIFCRLTFHQKEVSARPSLQYTITELIILMYSLISVESLTEAVLVQNDRWFSQIKWIRYIFIYWRLSFCPYHRSVAPDSLRFPINCDHRESRVVSTITMELSQILCTSSAWITSQRRESWRSPLMATRISHVAYAPVHVSYSYHPASGIALCKCSKIFDLSGSVWSFDQFKLWFDRL